MPIEARLLYETSYTLYQVQLANEVSSAKIVLLHLFYAFYA